VPAEHPGLGEDLNDSLEFYPPRMQDFLNLVSASGGVAQVY
jgi:hypothetical protein